MTKKSKYGMPAVQNYAFGGIANPAQRAFLRGSDQSYLDARQKELDAYEAQRLAYNDSLTKWQNEVYNPYKQQVDAYNAASQKYNEDIYNPYKAQVDAYNTAAQKYNEEVYNPYKTQFDKYKEAVDAWNAGDRTTDYAGPAAPTLASEFSMTAPTQPKAFEMAAPTTPEQFKGVAPTLPFKEEEVKAYQQEAANRARKDAGNRAAAIDVVSNPDQFNFGSMSVSNRFMAEGGEVMDDAHDKTARSIIKDFQKYGYTKDELMALADEVAAKGRGGDELLAYLSPESVNFLKAHGGSGTINPATGLHEFKGGVIGNLVNSIRRVFSPRSAAPEAAAAAPAAQAPAAAETAKMPSAADLMKQLEEANSAKAALQTKYETDLSSFKTQAQKDQEAAIAAALKADAEKRAGMVSKPVIGDFVTASGLLKKVDAATPSGDPMSRNFVGPRSPEEEAKFKALDQSTASYNAPGGPGFALMSPQDKFAALDKANATYNQPGGPGYALNNPPKPKDQIASPGLVGGTIGSRSVSGGPVRDIPIQMPNISFTPINAANPLGKVNLGGRVSSPVVGRRDAQETGGSRTTPQAPDNSSIGNIPIASPVTPDYGSRGVGQIGAVGGSNIPIYGTPTGPMFGSPNARPGGAATNPSSYFAMTPQSSTGLAPGSAAIGPAELPLYGAKNTMNAIGSNPNLSPTMLGGVQNAGVMTDRLGNRIYSPGMGPLYGFAKGGGVDLSSLMEQNASNLSDEKPEETINTDPVGSAQQFLQELGGQTTYSASPTMQSIKRSRVTPMSGDGVKGMKMEYESLTKGDLGSMKDMKPEARNTDSAKAQMEELARTYKLKIRAAENKARGLMSDTFGAPTLEGPTLTKGSLTKKRFEKGGEAKKAGAENAEEPSIFGVTDYATKASARMFPDQLGQDDQRDAARHMLAAATVAKKFGPGAAEFLGKAHERLSSPKSFFNMLGIGEPRYDYDVDVHNNRIGADLASRTTSQAELEKLVREMALQSQNKQVQGKPWTMSREQLQAVDEKNQKAATPPQYRADGSPEEGETGPAFVTPKSGKGRKEGPISQALKSGEAYSAMAQGVADMPYNLVGAPVDIATMVMRPFGYNVDKPAMGSDWIKEKMTNAGVRPATPTDPTQKGFHTAGELLSGLVNPAGATRTGVRTVQRAGQAAADVAKDFQEYNRQLSVPGASYAVRPTGSTVMSGPIGLNKNVSEIDQLLQNGISNARSVAGQNVDQEKLIEQFWDKKARNYFTRQFGTPDDPIATAISKKQIKGTALDETFPEYMLDQISAGKTRVNEQGQERFFPKYPRAMEDFTKRYDQATGLKGNLISTDPAAADVGYNMLSSRGREMARNAGETEADKMIRQGLRPELINPEVGTVTRSVKDPERILSDGTNSSKDLFAAFEEASAYNKMTPEQQAAWANEQFGKGRRLHGLDYEDVGKNLLPENILTAINKGEPVYDIGYMSKPLRTLFKPDSINTYLASLSPRELANIRFEDAVRGGLKMSDRAAQLENVAERIKSGKPVADSVFSQGVSGPLLQIKEGPLEGFAWKRIEKREATVPEGAYVGHSVGGYETGGATYTSDKREGFNTGKWQVYTLRDNRNRPVNTIEVKMLDEDTPVVTQIKGNGRATGNTAPEKYDSAVVQFLQNYLKPAAIEESDSYLTPILQQYKSQLGPSPRTR